jgi:hypothetical protein
MTTRERREARAERLRGWAEKRETHSHAAAEKASAMADVIPFGQPILVGHYSESRDRRYRDRIGRTMDDAVKSGRMAESMSSRATNIERALDESIFDDDPDATEQLTARIARLEAEREAMKQANAAYRKTHKTEFAALTAFGRSQAIPHPGYQLSNLGGRIAKDRKRLEWVTIRQARAAHAEESSSGVTVDRRGSGYCLVTFAEKPDRSTIGALKAAGFRWGGGSWGGRTEVLPAEITNQERGA